MIKPIQIYVVDDGTRFDKYDDAVAYEELCKRCFAIEAKLTPRTAEVENMTGYVTHDPVLFKEALTEFKELTCKEFNLDETRRQNMMKSSYLGTINIVYYLSDLFSNKKCMNELYFRFSCTSPETLQEFQQPYYASHLDDAYRDIKRNKENLNI